MASTCGGLGSGACSFTSPAFALSETERAEVEGRYAFASGRSSHADRLATIRTCQQRYGRLVDPHTADGLKVALERRQAGVPMIVLETALPAKFAETLREATGQEPPRPAGLEGIEDGDANVTRFVLVMRDDERPTGRDRTTGAADALKAGGVYVVTDLPRPNCGSRMSP